MYHVFCARKRSIWRNIYMYCTYSRLDIKSLKGINPELEYKCGTHIITYNVIFGNQLVPMFSCKIDSLLCGNKVDQEVR